MGSSDTLRSVIDAGRSSKRLDELSSARVIGKIALQVHAAQQKAGAGKAVGPITPAHIKLASSGEAKLELGDGSSLGYSSPEQITAGTGDRRSDVFSLGAVLWEALTYQRLFDAMNDAAVRIAVQEREIVPPSEINANIPAELSAICMRALSRNPTDRYQSAKAMAVELEEFLEEAGYADDDSKIAAYLSTLHEPPQQVKITMPPLTRRASSTEPPPVQAAAAPEKQASGTQPPPNVLKQPAAPSMLGEPPKQPAPTRAKSTSGAALAAALANAGKEPATSNGATTASASGVASTSVGLPPASYASTAVGVAKLDEWQDKSTPAHAPPSAAAPAVPAVDPTASAAGATAAANVPATPLPPVLPASSAQLRTDKSTIAVAAAVPPPAKATVDAKHAEAKQPALIVEEPKPKALIVEEAKPAPPVADTLVDTRPPEIEVPKLVDGKLPEPVKPSQAETLPVAALPPQQAVEAKPARPKSQSDAPRTRAPSQGDQSAPRTRAPSQGDKAAPHPASAVSLGPIPGGRDSKDVLDNWGWGTDKHNAIVPEDYPHDDFEEPAHDSKKTLMYVIGGGLALAALVTIIAIAAGGSSHKKKLENTAAKQADTSRPAIDQPAPPPTPAPAAAAAAAEGSATAAAQPSEADKQQAAKEQAAKDAAAQAEAAKAEADRVAAEKETARQAEVAKAEAAKAEAEAKKTEAARLAQEKADQKKAEQDAKKAEAARLAQEKADQKKADAARLAAERAEAKKAEAAKRAEAAKLAKTETKKTETRRTETTAKKTEAKGEPKVDVEATYRAGLQQFARGDTQGALASLRSALAANPNYAPTWRGLGLVFEKMGEKDQARAAFKRYLQLSPSAGDADQIKSRLERLGS